MSARKKANLKVVSDNADPMTESDGLPKFPEYLPSDVRDVWESATSKLRDRGMLTDEVLPVIESYVIAVWDQRDAIKAIQKDGRTFKAKGGEIKKNPAVSDLKAAREEVLRFATALGLTPTELTKLGESGDSNKDGGAGDDCPVSDLVI